MINLKTFVTILLFVSIVYCPPIQNNKKPGVGEEEFMKLLNSINYGSYLTQVMEELQSDEEFNNKIKDANDSNTISNALKFASPNIRSKLDELKRLEIIRLNKLQKESDKRKTTGYHPHEMPIPPMKDVDISHLDDIDPATFNPEDLKRLIDKTTEIFTKIDQENDENYKRHEMEKEARKLAELERNISDTKLRQDAQEKWHKEQKLKHAKHKIMNEPGSMDQLKTVWKEEDHMDEETFDARTFFFLHDVNSDGNLDVAELETLMRKELDKAYDPTDNETDLLERYHEMARMRKQFLDYVDLDKNFLVSYAEFMKWTEGDLIKKEKQWKTQEELEPKYSQEEFDEYYKNYLKKEFESNPPPVPPPVTPMSSKNSPPTN